MEKEERKEKGEEKKRGGKVGEKREKARKDKKKKEKRGEEQKKGGVVKEKIAHGEIVKISFSLSSLAIRNFDSRLQKSMVILRLKLNRGDSLTQTKVAMVKNSESNWTDPLSFTSSLIHLEETWQTKKISLILVEDGVKKQKRLAKWKMDLSEVMAYDSSHRFRLRPKQLQSLSHRSLTLTFRVQKEIQKIGKRRVIDPSSEEQAERVVEIDGVEYFVDPEEVPLTIGGGDSDELHSVADFEDVDQLSDLENDEDEEEYGDGDDDDDDDDDDDGEEGLSLEEKGNAPKPRVPKRKKPPTKPFNRSFTVTDKKNSREVFRQTKKERKPLPSSSPPSSPSSSSSSSSSSSQSSAKKEEPIVKVKKMTIHLKIETTSRGDLSGTTCSYDSSSLVSDVLKEMRKKATRHGNLTGEEGIEFRRELDSLCLWRYKIGDVSAQRMAGDNFMWVIVAGEENEEIESEGEREGEEEGERGVGRKGEREKKKMGENGGFVFICADYVVGPDLTEYQNSWECKPEEGNTGEKLVSKGEEGSKKKRRREGETRGKGKKEEEERGGFVGFCFGEDGEDGEDGEVREIEEEEWEKFDLNGHVSFQVVVDVARKRRSEIQRLRRENKKLKNEMKKVARSQEERYATLVQQTLGDGKLNTDSRIIALQKQMGVLVLERQMQELINTSLFSHPPRYVTFQATKTTSVSNFPFAAAKFLEALLLLGGLCVSGQGTELPAVILSGIRLAFKLAQGGLEIERRKENEKEEMEEGEKEREEREKDEGARDERGRYELKEKAGSLDNLVYLLRVCISLLSLLFHTHWKTVQNEGETSPSSLFILKRERRRRKKKKG